MIFKLSLSYGFGRCHCHHHRALVAGEQGGTTAVRNFCGKGMKDTDGEGKFELRSWWRRWRSYYSWSVALCVSPSRRPHASAFQLICPNRFADSSISPLRGDRHHTMVPPFFIRRLCCCYAVTCTPCPLNLPLFPSDLEQIKRF